MTCQESITQANDFIDDTLSPLERARLAAHIDACPDCARYHNVLRRGLQLVHAVDEIEPTPGFTVRMHRRLRGLDEERTRRERVAISGATVAIAVAGLIALAAWAPVWQESIEARNAETVAARADRNPGAPTVELPPGDWWYGWQGGPAATQVIHRSATFPGPYSPLVVQPPAVSGSRASTALLGESE